MITVLHGENLVQSREKLNQLIQLHRAKNFTITPIDGKKVNLAELEEKLKSQSLFGEQKLVVIESLHSLPRSKKKNQLIELITSSEAEIILWEKRELTATMIKKFPSAKCHHFKTSSSLFTWLDSLTGTKNNLSRQLQLLRKAIEQDGEQMCFVMLARQIKMLIAVKDNGQVKGHPFVVNKVKQQAKDFTLRQLLTIHQQLVKIDYRQKTSTNLISLEAELDLLLINM